MKEDDNESRPADEDVPETFLSAISERLKNARKILSEAFYGFAVHEFEVQLRKDKGDLYNLFMLIVFGDLIGLPLLPPYYAMRLIPHILPYYEVWRRNLLREKDLMDMFSGDL